MNIGLFGLEYSVPSRLFFEFFYESVYASGAAQNIHFRKSLWTRLLKMSTLRQTQHPSPQARHQMLGPERRQMRGLQRPQMPRR